MISTGTSAVIKGFLPDCASVELQLFLPLNGKSIRPLRKKNSARPGGRAEWLSFPVW